MRDETLALHAGLDADPVTKAVAVPIHQTAAYQFDFADHGAILFNDAGFPQSRYHALAKKFLKGRPASATHRKVPEAGQRKAGVTPKAIRLSVGIEHRDDIIADFDQPPAAAMRGHLRQVAR